MKKIILTGAIILCGCLMGTNILSQNLLVNPESVVYDTVGNRYLVSNYGNGAIVQVDADGNQDYFNTDLLTCNVVGLHIRGNNLYASTNGITMSVNIFDLSGDTAIGNIEIPGAIFLNDITSDNSGYIYVTDYEANRIYKLRLSDNNVSTFVNTGLFVPNGILFDDRNDRLLVSLHSNSQDLIGAVNLSDSSLTTVVDVGVNVDGITVDDERNIYVSTWSTNVVYRYDPDFSAPKTAAASGFSSPADIFFNKKHSLLAVPNFNANRLDLIPLEIGTFTRDYNNGPVNMGATYGISWTDIDNNGYPDLYLANSQLPDGQANGLFHNNNGTFNGLSSGAVVEDIGFSRTSTWSDCDNDGDLDVFVVNGQNQANQLYLNNGDQTFTPVIGEEIVTELDNSLAASWADYDNDGKVDLFVANNGINSLFRNTGTAFIRITDVPMVLETSDATGAAWADYNNDGYIDLFVPQSSSQNNHLYTNNGDGTFTSIAEGDIVNRGGNSCGGSWGDYDNDGDLDLFVPNMYDENNFLYSNQGDGTFLKISTGDVVTDGGFSYGSAWGDYDNDGDLDLFVANTTEGASSGQDFLYQNQGDGSFLKIKDCEIVDEIEDSYGAAWADFDGDGSLDLFVGRASEAGAAANGFYKNNGNNNNWIKVKCIGAATNSTGIGTKIHVKANVFGESVWQMREISAQTGFGGQNALDAHFGLGDAENIDSVVIEWPTSRDQIITNVEVNQIIEVTDFLCGDPNNDTGTNVADIVYILTYIFHDGLAPIPYSAGDVNCDGAVNIGDAVYLGNYVFQPGSPAPCETCP